MDIKYSYLIQIICTQFYDIKYSYLIQIICTPFYDIKYSYLIQMDLHTVLWYKVFLSTTNTAAHSSMNYKYSYLIQIMLRHNSMISSIPISNTK